MLLSSAFMCLALNIYHEARGEPIKGQVAVAKVTLHRAHKRDATVCKTVLRRKQFSWTTGLVTYENGHPKLKARGMPKEPEAWLASMVIAGAVLLNVLPNPVPKATHYHTVSVNPYWAGSYKVVAVIGQHIFYR